MIGIVLLFLVTVHLSVGMLMSLVSLSQKQLGEKFFRFNAVIALVLLTLAVAVDFYQRRVVPESLSFPVRFWIGQMQAVAPWLLGVAVLTLVYLVTLPFRRYILSRVLLIAASVAGCAAVVLLPRGWTSPAVPESVGFVFSFGFLVSALMLGSVTICMILGHWYLVEPGMSIGPLKVMSSIFILGVIVRSILGGYTAFLVWEDVTVSGSEWFSNGLVMNLLFYCQRVLFGLVLPLALSWMIWQTVKIRSTQSATGILYVAVVFVIFGEFLAHYLLVATGYPF